MFKVCIPGSYKNVLKEAAARQDKISSCFSEEIVIDSNSYTSQLRSQFYFFPAHLSEMAEFDQWFSILGLLLKNVQCHKTALRWRPCNSICNSALLTRKWWWWKALSLISILILNDGPDKQIFLFGREVDVSLEAADRSVIEFWGDIYVSRGRYLASPASLLLCTCTTVGCDGHFWVMDVTCKRETTSVCHELLAVFKPAGVYLSSWEHSHSRLFQRGFWNVVQDRGKRVVFNVTKLLRSSRRQLCELCCPQKENMKAAVWPRAIQTEEG